MTVFACPGCGQLVYFANTACLACGTAFAFDPASMAMVAVGPEVARCANAEVAACNWRAAAPGALCDSCVLTRTRPAEDDLDAIAQLQVAEGAKRRLVFQLLRLGLPLEVRDEARGTGVAFDLLSSTEQPVTTGHAGGVITLDLAESDAVHREKVRTLLSEPYRTVLGHFRHEIGHYFFPVLLPGEGDREAARGLFGDEREDYQAALDRHYAQGAPEQWGEQHVSEYATMHPAEDWAETFAHYLHIRGVLHTAASWGLQVRGPQLPGGTQPGLSVDPAGLEEVDAEGLIGGWLPLSYALNAVNRSMGEADLYPFVLSPVVMTKLAFIHDRVGRVSPRGAR